MRTLDAQTNQERVLPNVVVAHLLKFDLGIGGTTITHYLTDYFKNVQYAGNNYQAQGDLLTITGLTESSTFEIQQCKIQLSGINRVFLQQLISYNYTCRNITIYKQFFRSVRDATYIGDASLIPDRNLYERMGEPIEFFNGKINAPTIQDNPNNDTTTITVSATSVFGDFNKRSGRHTNDMEQKTLSQEDDFFALCGKIDEDIIWGKE